MLSVGSIAHNKLSSSSIILIIDNFQDNRSSDKSKNNDNYQYNTAFLFPTLFMFLFFFF